jgi:hypothetical protein
MAMESESEKFSTSWMSPGSDMLLLSLRFGEMLGVDVSESFAEDVPLVFRLGVISSSKLWKDVILGGVDILNELIMRRFPGPTVLIWDDRSMIPKSVFFNRNSSSVSFDCLS